MNEETKKRKENQRKKRVERRGRKDIGEEEGKNEIHHSNKKQTNKGECLKREGKKKRM